jgi:hypothetical protein
MAAAITDSVDSRHSIMLRALAPDCNSRRGEREATGMGRRGRVSKATGPALQYSHIKSCGCGSRCSRRS